MRFRHIFLIFSLGIVMMGSEIYAAEKSKEPKQFTFSWQFLEHDSMKPRGGTTKGQAVELEPRMFSNWQKNRNSKKTKFQKDSMAIMSLAGMYRVSFDFLETVIFENNLKPDSPYQSWGTEYIFPIEVKDNFISLQHILIMKFASNEIQPYVMKHWREDWTYEDRSMLLYTDKKNWGTFKISPKKSKGKWTQAVFQVDDSPRYEGIGKWTHNNTYSTWMSNLTLRPLPRREFSVRDDYDLLKGHNRITITPQGWIHEEDNLKTVVGISDSEESSHTFKAREIGIARYEKIGNFPTKAADDYWGATKLFWADVRDEWKLIIKENKQITLKSDYNDEKLFAIMFAYAAELASGKEYKSNESKKFVAETLKNFME